MRSTPASLPGQWLTFVFVTIFCLTASARLCADPVSGEVFTVRHPDGSDVQVRVWGDEFYRIVESLDGYTLVRDPESGFTCYAQRSADGRELISTGVPVVRTRPAHLDLGKHIRVNRASAIEKITAARTRLAKQKAAVLADLGRSSLLAPPNNGNVKGIVLLIDFADQEASIQSSEIDDYCDKVGYSGYGNNGSVRDYFYDVSDGNLTYTNFVPTSYYRAQQLKSWYDDPNIACCSRARVLLLEALNDLDDQGFDFSRYDSNGDGLIDAVNVLYAGTRNGPWSYGLWPHSGWITWSADGVSTGRYQFTDIGTQLRLRTFLHENGHMICYWPDLYDYGYESTGVGNFCLMCYGASNTNPAEPSAYMKHIAGWSTTITLAAPQSGLPAPAGINTLYKFEHPTAANEYYLMENRQKTGRDTYIPDAGLAIWHIDTLGNNDWEDMTPERHYEVTLVQADGDWDMENDRNYGDSTDLWAAPGYTECTPDTDPNTNWWDSSGSDLFITDISGSSATMTFSFMTTRDCNLNGIPDFEDIASQTSEDNDGNGIPDECECPAVSEPPQAQSPVIAKNRYLSLDPGNPGELTALRVTPINLPEGFEIFEGTHLWVGSVREISEGSGTTDSTPPTFTGAALVCDPVYTDWGAVGVVHVYGDTVVPGGIYQVQAINQSCDPIPQANYSAELALATARWGDAVGDCATAPCSAPNNVVDFDDIAALVDKFRDLPGAPIKSRVDIVPAIPDQVIDFSDIPAIVDAFRVLPYPYTAPIGCP